jgi:hypothetical protein
VTCDENRDLMAALRTARLDGPDRNALTDHLRSCRVCREALVAADPSFLFMEVAGEPLPADVWAGFQERLLARLPERKPASGWAGLFRYPKLAYAAPLAAALLLGVTVMAVRPGGIFAPRNRPDAIRLPYARAETAVSPARTAPPTQGAPLAHGGEAGPSSAPLLEEAGSPGARIYRFDAGGAARPGDETAIYLVVDESIDL